MYMVIPMYRVRRNTIRVEAFIMGAFNINMQQRASRITVFVTVQTMPWWLIHRAINLHPVSPLDKKSHFQSSWVIERSGGLRHW